jgi:hypothetical protein
MIKEFPRPKHENDRVIGGGSLFGHWDFVIWNSFGIGYWLLVIRVSSLIIRYWRESLS